MPYQKLTGILSICRKAGKLVLGFAPMKEALPSGKVCGVFMASDISPRSYKEVCFFCGKHNVPVYRLPLTAEQLGRAVGRSAAVAAVLDTGFSDRIGTLCTAAQAVCEPSE